jgi:hypothetical protein
MGFIDFGITASHNDESTISCAGTLAGIRRFCYCKAVVSGGLLECRGTPLPNNALMMKNYYGIDSSVPWNFMRLV